MKKKISEAEHGSRNITLTTNLASLTVSKLFGLSIKAGNSSIVHIGAWVWFAGPCPILLSVTQKNYWLVAWGNLEKRDIEFD